MMGNKKEIAESFLKLVSSGKLREAYHKYVHPEFHHHNPHFKGDRKWLLGSNQGLTERKRNILRMSGCI